ncbi:MAG: heavy-metal-associated domain-containing protein [Deltaproteobacteria bacterium]|nr:heavy-metal-associated domain-containing protein [Deltaproteobacteria bacterium]
MTCQNCVRHVKEALEELDGVMEAQVSLEEKTATVKAGEGFSAQEAARAIEEAGYQPGEVKTL